MAVISRQVHEDFPLRTVGVAPHDACSAVALARDPDEESVFRAPIGLARREAVDVLEHPRLEVEHANSAAQRSHDQPRAIGRHLRITQGPREILGRRIQQALLARLHVVLPDLPVALENDPVRRPGGVISVSDQPALVAAVSVHHVDVPGVDLPKRHPLPPAARKQDLRPVRREAREKIDVGMIGQPLDLSRVEVEEVDLVIAVAVRRPHDAGVESIGEPPESGAFTIVETLRALARREPSGQRASRQVLDHLQGLGGRSHRQHDTRYDDQNRGRDPQQRAQSASTELSVPLRHAHPRVRSASGAGKAPWGRPHRSSS